MQEIFNKDIADIKYRVTKILPGDEYTHLTVDPHEGILHINKQLFECEVTPYPKNKKQIILPVIYN